MRGRIRLRGAPRRRPAGLVGTGVAWFAFAAVGSWLAVSAAARDEGGRRAEAWVAPGRAARKPNPVPLNEAAVAAGRAIFQRECASCHGNGGKGDGPDAHDLGRMPTDLADPGVLSQSDGALFWKITEGRKPMPAFARMLDDTQRWQVVHYVRALGPRAPASPAR